MNLNWKNFLLSEQADFETAVQISFPAVAEPHHHCIYPLAHLAVLTIGGKDAATFLQGQITCNIDDLNETKSSLGALCNPKGRAIATFLLIKTGSVFLMILPDELLQTVKKRLSLYILRSDVVLTDSSDALCLIGLTTTGTSADNCRDAGGIPSGAQGATPPLKGGLGTGAVADDCRDAGGRATQGAVAEALFSTSQQDIISVNLGNRRLIAAMPEQAAAFWTEQARHGYRPASSAHWRYLDIISGLPWLTTATSEAFIPQMLNLDKLGGISFNKGCYTGQEIIARTHYLGKAKRMMFLAECNTQEIPAPNAVIIDDSAPSGADTEAEQTAGRVLLAEHWGASCKMLIVIPISDAGTDRLSLADHNKLTLLPLNTAL